MNSSYLPIWELDFTTKGNRQLHHSKRDIALEHAIETQVTEKLRNNFSFRYMEMDNQLQRMGTQGLESKLIGTLSHCNLCHPSANWLGLHSPKDKIRLSGLWLIQHLGSTGISDNDKALIESILTKPLQ